MIKELKKFGIIGAQNVATGLFETDQPGSLLTSSTVHV